MLVPRHLGATERLVVRHRMLPWIVLATGGLLAAVLSCAIWAGAAPVEQEIDRAIRELGDERFDVREKASAALFAAGFAAEPALRKAAAGDDPEVRIRAQKILDNFAHGIFPDTPREIVDLAGRYGAADEGEKLRILYELAGRGGNGCVVLMKLGDSYGKMGPRFLDKTVPV